MKRRLFKLVLFLLLGAVVNVAVAWGCANWHGNNPPLWKLFSAVFSATGIDKVREEVNDNDFPKDSYISLELIQQGDGLSVKSMEIQNYASGENWVKKMREDIPVSNLTVAKIPGYPFGKTKAQLWEDMSNSHLIAAKIFRTGIEQRIVFTGKVGRPKPDELQGGHWSSYRGRLDWAHITVGFPLKSLFYTPSSSSEAYSTDRQTKAWNLPNKLNKLFPSTNELILPYGVVWPSFAFNTVFYATILWLLTLGPFTARRFIRSKRGRCIKCGYDLRGDTETGCPECGWGREAEA